MLKVCVCLIYKLLEMIFNQCIEPGVFPFEWNKGYIGSIHKKGDKQTLERYRTESPLPTSERILERLYTLTKCSIFFFFLNENKLIYSNQSGFEQGDSCIQTTIIHYS